MTGYITKGIGGFYYVKTSEGIVECKPRGIFRKQIGRASCRERV